MEIAQFNQCKKTRTERVQNFLMLAKRTSYASKQQIYYINVNSNYGTIMLYRRAG